MIELGHTAYDKVTGFRGVLTGRASYIWDEVDYHLSPPAQPDGKYTKGIWVNEDRLNLDLTTSNMEVVREKMQLDDLTEPAFPMGVQAVDRVSGFAGIVTGHARYLAGSDRFMLVPRVSEDMAYREAVWFPSKQVMQLGPARLNLDDAGKGIGVQGGAPVAEDPGEASDERTDWTPKPGRGMYGRPLGNVAERADV